MPHTGSILHGRYAVVSCHVERPLDDEVWRRFSRLQRRRPGRFAIAALMRPPAAGENEELWLERAREAQTLAPLGLHTHWTAPDHARPTGGDPAALVREQGEWLRAAGLEIEFFCGGGWYIDADVARAVAELGYTDCTATAFRPSYLEAGAPHLQLDEPTWLDLGSGPRLLELPTTHSFGTEPTNVPAGRRTRRISATSASGSRRCSSSSPATTTSKLSASNSSGRS